MTREVRFKMLTFIVFVHNTSLYWEYYAPGNTSADSVAKVFANKRLNCQTPDAENWAESARFKSQDAALCY